MTDNPTTASGLVERLRARGMTYICSASRRPAGEDMIVAADALASLKRELADAREVIEPFADVLGDDDDDEPDHTQGTLVIGRSTHYMLDLGDFRRARAFLARNPDASPDGEGE